MLVVLEKTVRRLDRRERTDREMVEGIARFFDQFVGCHDEKDRQLLLPAVRTFWSAEEQPAAGSLGWNAARGRRLRGRLVRLLRRALSGVDAPPRLVATATEYAAHLRAQLAEEDRWFAVVLKRLSPDEDARLGADLARLDRQLLGPTGREWNAGLVADYRDIVSTWAAVPPFVFVP